MHLHIGLTDRDYYSFYSSASFIPSLASCTARHDARGPVVGKSKEREKQSIGQLVDDDVDACR